MNCSDDNLCFDIGTHVEASGVLENSTAVLAIQMPQLYWITSEISGCYNPRSMIIQTQDFRTCEAPPFMAGSSHDSCFLCESNDKKEKNGEFSPLLPS
jgi:hypothetical protein